MANINAPGINYFESFSDEIMGKFRRLQRIIGHPVASGNYHEEILRGIIRNFLPKRFSVKSGFIYAGSGNISKQIDILIIDENEPTAYIFQENDFAVVTPKAVVAVIEVKTVINVREFGSSIENIASAKRLAEFPSKLLGIVFGFDGSSPTDKNLNSWFKQTECNKFNGNEVITPEAIIFFSK